MRNVKINLYEVGDIFLTLNNINPGTRFKGTWELIAKGRTLVGVDPNDTDFNTVQKTGGSKELQEHYHKLSGRVGKAEHANKGGYYNGEKEHFIAGTYKFDSSSTGTAASNSLINVSDLPNSLITDNAGTGNSGNLQPYLTCYIWCRTA